MGFPTDKPIGPRELSSEAHQVTTAHWSITILRAAALPVRPHRRRGRPPPPHPNPTRRQRQFRLPNARLHERVSSHASSRPPLLVAAVFRRRLALCSLLRPTVAEWRLALAAPAPLPVCHRLALLQLGFGPSRLRSIRRLWPPRLGLLTYSAPSTSPPSHHPVIMSRALARRPVPPFLRQRSTVCDDGYWLGRLDHKDWLAPNEVLKIFANIRDPCLITNVFNKACNRRDYKPSEALYSLMIDKLACARRFTDVEELLARARTEKFRFSDEFFYRLIKMYGNVAEHPQKAIDTLFAMPGYNCWPSTKTFNYVLHMLVCKRQYEVVHEIYSSAPRLGVTVDTCSFNILIKGLCQFGKIDEAMSLLHEMPKQGCQPNVTTYSTLMHFLCLRCQVDKAFEVFERMQKQDIATDTVVCNILISGLCREERVTEAFDLFKSMTSEGCYPNSGTYQVLLDGLINSGKFVEAKNLVGTMSTEGVRPSFQSYKLLIDGLCSVGCLDDAHLVLKQMVGQGFVPRMGTWKKLLTSMC